jgi:mannosyltransferase
MAGLMFAVLPAVTRYAQEARSYAMVIAVAAIASYVLVRAVGAAPERRRRWLVGYGVSLAAVGILNIFALLLIPAHAVTIVLDYRRRAGGPDSRRLVIGWLIAAAASVVVASPLLVLGWSERGQISWLAVNKSSSGLGTLLTLDGSILVTFAVVAVIGISLVVSSEAGRERLQAAWPWPMIELTVPWLALPPLILLTGSLITPLYTSRYILMCLPALALICGAALAALGRIAGPVALAAILLAGLPTQLTQRGPAGHYDDIRSLDKVVAVQARSGDVVLYANPNAESFGAAYPYGLDALRNIALKQAAIPSGTLAGTTAPLAVIRQRLGQVSRVWVVEINKFVQVPEIEGLNGLPLGPAMLGLPFHLVKVWHEHGDWLLLYAHN